MGRQTIEEVSSSLQGIEPGELGPGVKADAGKLDLVLFPFSVLKNTKFALPHQALVESICDGKYAAAIETLFDNGWSSIAGVTRVLEVGARKYCANNWQNVRPGIRYVSAALRHLLATESGEALDPETGLPHLDHLGCCLVFALWQQQQGINLWEGYA